MEKMILDVSMNFTKSRYGYLALNDEDDLITSSVKTYGEWAQNEIWMIERLVKPGQTVLDVGAYIGTHTLALSEFVGPNGLVHCFEPQPEALQSLMFCIEKNELKNVDLHTFALGVDEGFVDLSSSKKGPNNAGSFSLNEIVELVKSHGDIFISKLDSLELESCDFIKIDVEGMEIFVLQGGLKTISKCRPVIMCECNFLQAGSPLVTWASEHGYMCYGVELEAFNPHNYLKIDFNIFNDSGEVSLILIPSEKKDLYIPSLEVYSISEVRTIDDLALVMLRKPQYIAEASALGLAFKSRDVAELTFKNEALPLNKNRINGDGGEIIFPRKFRVVIPFYKNPQLVRPLFNSLLSCADELTKLNAKIFFYNDSPGDFELSSELDQCLRECKNLDIFLISNRDNLGFVGTVNLAFDGAIEAHEDVVLLNSDTKVFSGVFLELARIAYSDVMIGFVSPRSNNATLCTLPHDSELLDASPEECYSRFKVVSKSLSPFTYVPTAVGFCLYIKWLILVEIGGFDLQYGKGYNEENDLIMRSNRLGYRAVLANHAFVWHQGEQSFGKLDRTRAVREEENAKLLNMRYPEFPRLVRDYFESPEYCAEDLLGALCQDASGRIRIGFDFSNFGTYHNGTFEAGKKLLYAAAASWPSDIEIVVFTSFQSWKFHGLDVCSRAKWIDTHQPHEKMAAIVRIGQPFDSQSIQRMLYRAPVVAVFMLDTIAYDCGYLKVEFDENIWHFTMRWFDIIFTNSAFTAEQFHKRFQVGLKTIIYPSLHSLTPKDYVSSEKSVGNESHAGGGCNVLKPRIKALVMGNKFEHKALISTVNRLLSALQHMDIVALGCSGKNRENVVYIESGSLSDDELSLLYSSVDFVVFPSHYEGFGFPIMHALVRNKPIYVRKLPVFEEIASRIIVGRENIRWFESTRDLIQQIAKGDVGWIGSTAIGETDGWNRSAGEVLNALRGRIDSVTNLEVADRIRWFKLAFNSRYVIAPKNENEIERATHFITNRFERFIRKVLSHRLSYSALKYVWHIF